MRAPRAASFIVFVHHQKWQDGNKQTKDKQTKQKQKQTRFFSLVLPMRKVVWTKCFAVGGGSVTG